MHRLLVTRITNINSNSPVATACVSLKRRGEFLFEIPNSLTLRKYDQVLLGPRAYVMHMPFVYKASGFFASESKKTIFLTLEGGTLGVAKHSTASFILDNLSDLRVAFTTEFDSPTGL